MSVTIPPHEEGDAVCWESGLMIDADGSPRAYHPDSKSGLDHLANAGHPTDWWGLATDLEGNPYVQGPTDPCPGFYVSTTSLQDRAFKASDPRRYLDSEQVKYITATRAMLKAGVEVGDLAVVVSPNGSVVGAVVGDVGPSPGEGSIALAQALGVNPDARRGGTNLPHRFVIFKGSSMGWPRPAYDETAVETFLKWGGLSRLAGDEEDE